MQSPASVPIPASLTPSEAPCPWSWGHLLQLWGKLAFFITMMTSQLHVTTCMPDAPWKGEWIAQA